VIEFATLSSQIWSYPDMSVFPRRRITADELPVGRPSDENLLGVTSEEPQYIVLPERA